MSLTVTGTRVVSRQVAAIDRRVTKERQAIIRKAAAKTLVRPMKAAALRSPGRAGPRLAKAVTARNGRQGAVLVGPRGGKRGAWFRHFFLEGAKPHTIGGAVSSGSRTFFSTNRAYASRGGMFKRSHGGRERRFLYNPAGPFVATGPVMHPGFGSNPFVEVGTEVGQAAFIAEIKKRFWVGDSRSGGTR